MENIHLISIKGLCKFLEIYEATETFIYVQKSNKFLREIFATELNI